MDRRLGRPATVILAALVGLAACADPSASPSDGVPTSGAPSPSSGSMAGAHEAARHEELRHWSGSFHDAPFPLPTAERGTLLRLDLVADDADKRVYRSMYLSTSVDGRTPVPVTGTIWVPAGEPPEGGFPIVAWAPGSNPLGLGIFGDGCAFSNRPVHPDTDHQDHFANLLADGFVVATTDYEGHGTRFPYLYAVGESDAHALLDAARAGRDLLGPAASDRVIVAGFSLGGLAAAQSLLYIEPYAGELDVRGVVSIEGVGDISADPGPPDPEAVNVMVTMFSAASWPRAYPELHPEDVLTAEGLHLLSELHENGCVWFSEYDTANVLDASVWNWLDIPSWAARMRAQDVNHAPYPVFYVIAEDNLLADRVRVVGERLCESADHVELRQYPGTDHDSVISAAYADWAGWMIDRVSGDAPFDGCTF